MSIAAGRAPSQAGRGPNSTLAATLCAARNATPTRGGRVLVQTTPAPRVRLLSHPGSAISVLSRGPGGRRDRDRSRRRDAPLLLEHLGQLGRLDHGKRRQIVYELCQFSHMVTPACVFEGHSSRVCSALIARLSGAVAGTGLFGGG